LTHAAAGDAVTAPDRLGARRAPGFMRGFSALPDALRFLAAERRCWLAASVPSLIVLGLAAPAFWFAFTEVGPRLSAWIFPHAGAWYLEGAHWLVRWLGSLVAAFFGFWLAVVVAPTLSAPALEYLVRAREAELGVFERPRARLGVQLRCGIEAQVGALLLAVPLWCGYWLLAIAFPGVLLLLPLQALPGALALAWNLLDYPLSLRGVRLRERWRLLRQHPGAMLGFAACLALVASIPAGVFLLLPAGVVGATRLSWELLPE
jgi:CysZ protein